MTDDADPVALHHRLQNVRIDRDAADSLDLSARDRLAIRDQGKRFEQCTRVASRPLRPQTRNLVGEFAANLDAIAAAGLLDLDTAAFEFVRELRNSRANLVIGWPGAFLKQLRQLQHLKRLASGQQRGLDDISDVGLIHELASSGESGESVGAPVGSLAAGSSNVSLAASP